VTTIADAAPVPTGATHLKDVWSTITATDVQSLPPTLTETRFAVALVPKFVPVTVMTNPPDVGLLPEVGRNALTTGSLYRNAPCNEPVCDLTVTDITESVPTFAGTMNDKVLSAI
jgi:hypothetical protein